MYKEIKGKKLLVLGGSAWFDIIKRFARDNDITLFTVGNNPASPLARIENYYEVDSTDHEKMKRFIKKNGIDGVYLGSNEIVIRHAVQYVSDLGLPCYCSLDQWDALMNKSKFKELCINNGLPIVERFLYTPNKHCELDYPVVVKPADGCGSDGVVICNSVQEVESGYKVAYDISATHDVIVEKMVKNSGMDVFLQINSGEVTWCLLGDKYPVQLCEGAGAVAGARVFPSIFTNEFRNRFEQQIKAMLKSIGLFHGLLWMEVFHDGESYYFNEAGYRPNGSLSIVGIDYLCGINTVAADIYYDLTGISKSTGFPSLLTRRKMSKNRVCEYWVASKPGVIGNILGLKDVYDHPNILAVFPKYDVGDTVPKTNGFAQNFCVIHFAYNTTEEMEHVIKFINEKVMLLDEEGKDMIIHKEENFIKNLTMIYRGQ